MSEANHTWEAAYSDALTMVASGEAREYAFGVLLDGYPSLEAAELSDILGDALYEALQQGVEREDVDPSWF